MCLECENTHGRYAREVNADGPPHWLAKPPTPAILKSSPRQSKKDKDTLPLPLEVR